MAARYRVRLTATAEADLREIHGYISRDSEGAADSWLGEIEHQVDTLERFPLRALVIPESEDLGIEYRHVLLGSYRTIFRVEGGSVLILRVMHGARLLDPSALNP